MLDNEVKQQMRLMNKEYIEKLEDVELAVLYKQVANECIKRGLVSSPWNAMTATVKNTKQAHVLYLTIVLAIVVCMVIRIFVQNENESENKKWNGSLGLGSALLGVIDIILLVSDGVIISYNQWPYDAARLQVKQILYRTYRIDIMLLRNSSIIT